MMRWNVGFAILAFMAKAWAQGQAIDGNIEGAVLDRQGAPVAMATVRATNLGTGLRKETNTDESGRYRLQLLPSGMYTLSVTKDGFRPVNKTGIELLSGRVVVSDFALEVGDVATVIEVTSAAPLVEAGRTEMSNTYGERVARNLPTMGRNMLDFFVLQPGVNANALNTQGSGTAPPLVVYGGMGFRQTNIDGVSNTLQGGNRNLLISQESIAEYQTVMNASAEFGRVAGGLQNAFTRSGGNAWHGSGYWFGRNKDTAATPFLQAAGAPKPDFFRHNFGNTLSGPIQRDRMFFFVNYERWMQDLPVVSTIPLAAAAQLGIPRENVGTYITSFRAHTVAAKQDWQVSKNHRLSTRYNFYFDRESQLQGGLQSRDVSTRFDESPWAWTTQLVSTLKPTLLNEFRILYMNRQVEQGVLNPAAPNINVSGVGSFNGNANGSYTFREHGWQLVNNTSWTKGSHQVKFGLDIIPVSFAESTTNINGGFVFGGLPAAAGRPAVTPLQQFLNTEARVVDPATGQPFTYTRFTQSVGRRLYEATMLQQGYFVQDDWRLSNRFKVNAGLRYEFFARPNGNLNPLLPATGNIPEDRNNIAPRLGFAWDLFGSSKTVLRGGYGIYYNTPAAQTFTAYLRGNGVEVVNINVLPNAPGAPAFTRGPVPQVTGVSAISDIRLIGAGFQDPMVHSFFFTVDQELSKNHSLQLSYMGTRGRDLPLSLIDNLTQVGTLPDGRRRWTGANRPDPRFGNIFRAASDGFQNYNGLVATLTRRLSHGLSLQASYHYSKTEGVAFTNQPGSIVGFGIAISPSDPQNPRVDRGPGDFDMRHRFTLTGVYETQFQGLTGFTRRVVNGWMLASRTIAQTGFAFTGTTGADDNGDSVFNDRPVGAPYNSYNLPGYFTIDLRLARIFTVKERHKFEVIAETFNTANRLNATNVVRVFGLGTAPNANFRMPTQAETQRQLQLAVRYSF
jgi:hypothetical protein